VRQVEQIACDGDVRLNAAIAFCKLSGEARYRHKRHAPQFVQTFGDLLRSTTEAWAWAGHALDQANTHKRTIEWMSGWQQRDGLEAWMILPLASSLFCSDDEARAAEVSAAALSLPPDMSVSMHQVFVGWVEAQSRATAATALERLAGLDTHGAWPLCILVGDFAREMASVNAARPAQRAATLKRAVAAMKALWRKWPYKMDLASQRMVKQVRRNLAQHMGRGRRWLYVNLGL